MKIERSEDRELNQATSKPDTVDRPVRTARTFVHHYNSTPDTVDRPVRTARTFVHHYNSTQYCSTKAVFLIFRFLQTNITSQIWPPGGKGRRYSCKNFKG